MLESCAQVTLHPSHERTNVRPLSYMGDDVELVEALRRGSRPAVAHFYSRFAPQVHRLLFRILGHDSELEDAVHDTFVRALESIHGLRDPKALRSWIIGIAIYAARIRIQRRRRRRWLQLAAPADLPEREFFDPTAEARKAVRALARVLDQMPADERVAVVLRLAEGMTLREAAAAIGISRSTLKRRLARGQNLLRELVAQEPALVAWQDRDTDKLNVAVEGVRTAAGPASAQL